MNDFHVEQPKFLQMEPGVRVPHKDTGETPQSAQGQNIEKMIMGSTGNVKFKGEGP